MSFAHYCWLTCNGCGRRWEARIIRRSATSPGGYTPDYCLKCFREGTPEDA